MKIILSTDFSEENKVLLPYAIDFLKNAGGGEIIIFHAYMDNICIGNNCYPGNIDTDNYFTTEILIELEKTSQLMMQEKCQYLIDLIKEDGADNIIVRSVLVSGDPEEELIELSKKENPDPTPKEKKEISAEEKEMKSKRKQIQEKLIKFATRIPVFMYLTDYRER